MQRFFDIFFSGLALLVLAPLMIPIVIILTFTGEGEIFYIQKRVGKKGEVFDLLKFATMLKDSPNLGTGTITVKGDPRVLPFGKFLRKTKINELTQLLNILKGDMSIIGPRPITEKQFSNYLDTVQESIKKVRPGLSGIGSIIFRDEEEILSREEIEDKKYFHSNIIMPYKGKVEFWYVENRSLMLYFKLILLTIIVVIFPHYGIHYAKLFKDFPEPPAELHLREIGR